MTTSITASSFSFEHQGIERLSTAASHLDGVRAEVAAPAVRVLAKVGASLKRHYRAWLQARRQELEDQRTWEIALQDARVMADLSRAMSAAARQR